jgi:hypothetical protein
MAIQNLHAKGFIIFASTCLRMILNAYQYKNHLCIRSLFLIYLIIPVFYI